MSTIALMTGATAPTSSVYPLLGTGISSRAFQASVNGSGAVSAQITLDISNDNANWVNLMTFTLSGNNNASDAKASFAPWSYIRTTLNSISGTSAEVDVSVSI